MRSPVAEVSGDVLVEERAVLPPDPRSAGAARRLVRSALQDAARGQWVDTVELAVSELVSNSVLHAHTEIELTVRVEADGVCVAVLDHSPLLPAPRLYGEHATTGRGLGLVATLATAFGIDRHEGDGKTVWFRVDDTETEVVPDLDAWDDEGWEPPEPPPTEAVGRATLLALPVSLWLAAQQHHDALIREYVLARASETEPGMRDLVEDVEPTTAEADDAPALATVLAADAAQGLFAAAVDEALEQAQAAGVPAQPLPLGHPSPLPPVPPSLDVTITVGTDDVTSFAALQDALDAAERLAAQGRLLARPALPDVVAVRDWACEQVIAQLGGVEPAPWPGLPDDDEQLLPHREHSDSPDLRAVTGAGRPVVAADESNRIVAVSEPLARLLGWRRDDLVGRRVVALIPPRLRELHVAGFTRHLTTGEAHVLGVPLELPVLHADGHELTCRFLLERLPAGGQRGVYLAWLDPVDDGAGA